MTRVLTVGLIIAALVALFLFGLLRGAPDRNVPSSLLGKAVPDFELPVYELYQAQFGPSFRLEDHLGQPIVLNFWATWCLPCRDEAPVLEAFWRRYQDRALFIGVQTQERGGQAQGRAFINEFNLSFPNLKDDNSRVSIDYALFGVPETYFILADGTLHYKHIGPVSASLMQQKLEEILQ